MDSIKVIKERRSIRRYLDKEIKLEIVSEILEAGSYAPSSGNVQNWRFLVVKDKKKREEIADACLGQTWMNQAPVHIVVCSDNRDINAMYKKRSEKYSVQNCAAAVQNILLAAYDKGLGSCWVGAFNEDRIKRILFIPDNVSVEAVITIGYAAYKPIIEDKKHRRRHKVEYVTFFEKYGERELDFKFWPLVKQYKKLDEKVSLEKIKKLFRK